MHSAPLSASMPPMAITGIVAYGLADLGKSCDPVRVAESLALTAYRKPDRKICSRPPRVPRRAPLQGCGMKRRWKIPPEHFRDGTMRSRRCAGADSPPRCTPAAPAASATSSRSFTITRAPGANAPADLQQPHRGQFPAVPAPADLSRESAPSQPLPRWPCEWFRALAHARSSSAAPSDLRSVT